MTDEKLAELKEKIRDLRSSDVFAIGGVDYDPILQRNVEVLPSEQTQGWNQAIDKVLSLFTQAEEGKEYGRYRRLLART